MKVLMINDTPADGREDDSALSEMKEVFDKEHYDVDVIHVSSVLTDEIVQETATHLSGSDIVVFENADETSRNLLERILSASVSDNLQAANDALQVSNDTLTRNNATLQENNDSLTRDNAGLRESNDTLTRDNASLQESNTHLTRDNANLTRDNASLQESNNTLTRNNAILQESNDTLTRSNASLTKNNVSLQASNDTLTRNNATLRENNDALTRNNATLQENNDSLTRDNTGLRESNDTLTRNNASLTRDNENLQRDNVSLQESNVALSQDNATLQESNDTLQRNNDSLRANNDRLQTHNDELQKSNDTLQRDNDELQRNYNTLQENNILLHHNSVEDKLTRVLNRRGYDEYSQKFMAEHASFILISIDINDFKLFNDLYGHHIGDECLKVLGDEFRKLVPHGDIIARSGGDEFQLVIAQPAQAWMKKASGFFNGVHTFEFEGKKYTYSLSAGFASFPEQTNDWETLCRMADAALYHAKMLAKEKFWKYQPEMDNDFRYSLGFNAKNLAESAPGAMLIYRADDTNEILFANPLAAELFGYDSVSDFTREVKSFLPLIYQDDVDRVEKDLEAQSESKSGMNKEFTSYRITCRDGRTRNVLSVRRLIGNDHFGNIFYSFLFDSTAVG